MKNINYLQLCVCFFLATISLLNISCEKQLPPTTANTPADTPSDPLPPGNPASGVNALPQAFAGSNVNIEWPHNSVILSGAASHETGTTISGAWEKISGPANFSFENKQSLYTKVNDLEKGIYQFELTVTDNHGKNGKDTMSVIVGEFSSAPQEHILKDRNWACPWDCALELGDITSIVPAGVIFRVYIQRDASTKWELAQPYGQFPNGADYEYYWRNGSFSIHHWGSADDTPDVKVTF